MRSTSKPTNYLCAMLWGSVSAFQYVVGYLKHYENNNRGKKCYYV